MSAVVFVETFRNFQQSARLISEGRCCTDMSSLTVAPCNCSCNAGPYFLLAANAHSVNADSFRKSVHFSLSFFLAQFLFTFFLPFFLLCFLIFLQMSFLSSLSSVLCSTRCRPLCTLADALSILCQVRKQES